MELLKKLTQANSPSGNENEIRDIIKEYAHAFCDDIRVDALGNLIVHKKGNGKKIMLCAHMDEIGIIVTYIEKTGYLRFAQVGGLYTKQLVGRRVKFSNGTVGVISLEAKEKEPTIEHMFIDIGAKNADEAEKFVNIGDTASFCGELVQIGDRVISKALDNRIGCYVLLRALEQCDNCENDLYFVFSVQEEVGLRGAKTAGFGVMPELAVAVDVTDTGDTPESGVMAVELGGGAAIKVMDRSCMCDVGIRTNLLSIANKNNIPYQLEIMNDGGTDAGAIHLTASGVPTGGISIPARYIHSPSEICDMKDVKACIDLTVLFCKNT